MRAAVNPGTSETQHGPRGCPNTGAGFYRARREREREVSPESARQKTESCQKQPIPLFMFVPISCIAPSVFSSGVQALQGRHILEPFPSHAWPRTLPDLRRHALGVDDIATGAGHPCPGARGWEAGEKVTVSRNTRRKKGQTHSCGPVFVVQSTHAPALFGAWTTTGTHCARQIGLGRTLMQGRKDDCPRLDDFASGRNVQPSYT